MASKQFAGLFGGASPGDIRSLMEQENQGRVRQAFLDQTKAGGGPLAANAARYREQGLQGLDRMLGAGADLMDMKVPQDPRMVKANKTEKDKTEILRVLDGYAKSDGRIDENEMMAGYSLLMSKGYPNEARKFLDDAKKLADIDRLKASAKKDRMGPGAGKPQKGRTYMLEDGSQLKGVTVFQGGVEYIQKANGDKVPIPDDAREITPGMLKNAMLPQKEFLKIKKEILTDVHSIRRLSTYAEGVGGSKQGLSLLADGFIASLKTLANKKLTDSQLKTLIQKGDFNALIGRFRKEVVGQGVMTEPDAKRIMLALGDDISAWRNKRVVGEQLKKLFQDKLDFIKNNVEDYNNQVGWQGRGKLSKIEVPKFDMKVFDDLTTPASKKKKKTKVPRYITKYVNGKWVSTLNPAYTVGGTP